MKKNSKLFVVTAPPDQPPKPSIGKLSAVSKPKLGDVLRKAYSGEPTHQGENVAALAEKLAAEARSAGEDFRRLHRAVINFIRNLDGFSDYEPCVGVLGDAEFGALFRESLERRGKLVRDEARKRFEAELLDAATGREQ